MQRDQSEPKKQNQANQKSDKPKSSFKRTKQCHFGKNCWNKGNCPFYHPNHHFNKQGLQSPQQMNFPTPYRNQHHMNAPQNPKPKPVMTSSLSFVKDEIELCSKPTKQSEKSILGADTSIQKRLAQNQGEQGFEVPEDLNSLNQIYLEQQNFLQQKLEEFFNPRLVGKVKFDKIFNYLEDKLSANLYDLYIVLDLVEKLEADHTVMENFSYVHLVRTIVKRNFDFEDIMRKLFSELEVKRKKEQKIEQYLQEVENPIEYSVLSDAELLKLYESEENSHNIVVDGNNVLPSNKILRRYFQSYSYEHKVEGQIRLRWLLSEVENCSLFYDQLFVSEEQTVKKQPDNYWQICKKIMYEEDLQRLMTQECHYARVEYYEEEQYEESDDQPEQEQNQQQSMHEMEKNRADDLIIQFFQNRLKICKESEHFILITADRILIQKCLQIFKQRNRQKLWISSGKQLVKMCKQSIRRKYFSSKKKKGVIKRIFIDPRQPNQ